MAEEKGKTDVEKTEEQITFILKPLEEKRAWYPNSTREFRWLNREKSPVKYSVARAVVKHVLTVKKPLTKEEKNLLIEQHESKKDKKNTRRSKSKKRLTEVLALLRKLGLYKDQFTYKTTVWPHLQEWSKEHTVHLMPDVPRKKKIGVSIGVDATSQDPQSDQKAALTTGSTTEQDTKQLLSKLLTENQALKQKLAEQSTGQKGETGAALDTNKEKTVEDQMVDKVLIRLAPYLRIPNNPGKPVNNPESQLTLPVQGTDSEKLAEVLARLPPETHRLYLKSKSEKIEDPMLQAFTMMEADMSWVDVMDTLNLNFDQMKEFAEKYNNMIKLQREKDLLNEPMFKAVFDTMGVRGEVVRSYCRFYHEVNGTCRRWAMSDIPKSYRDQFPGLFYTARVKGVPQEYLLRVERNPAICYGCPIGLKYMLEDMS